MRYLTLIWIFAISFFCITSYAAVTTTASTPTISSSDNLLPTSISSNPVAVNVLPGTMDLQHYLQQKFNLPDSHGVDIGGTWLLDTNKLISGGIPDPRRWTSNSSFLAGLTADMQQFAGWRNGLFSIQMLQVNSQPVNEQVGTVQGYNSLPGPKPLVRTELYQLWYRQTFFDNKLIFRIGKSATTAHFNNVVKPIPLSNERLFIPAVSGLIYTPIFVNSSMLGVIPGYYNSAYGITASVAPNKKWYASYGIYDGNLARGTQIGDKVGPTLNGSYFHIGETGLAWLLGKNHQPGDVAIGGWYQAGRIQGATNFANSAAGFYLFGTQRVWYRHPEIDTSGISIFYQYGINNSNVLPVRRYYGAGLTAFGLIANRCDDSMGLGEAYSRLNQLTFPRADEIIWQAYYQAKVTKDIYLEPVISYVPHPGEGANLNAAWAGTIRAIIMF